MKLAFLIGVLLLASADCLATDIRSITWNANQQTTLNAVADLPAQVRRLLVTLLPNADVVRPAIGETCFVDLDRDGTLELVATVDDSGRGFFDNVVVVRQQQDGFTWTSVRNDGPSIEHLAAHLVDADGDGVPELVLGSFMDRYEGALRVPVETVIYRWGPSGFHDESNAFPQYYRTYVIPMLERQLGQASSSRASTAAAPTDRDDDVFVLETELARARHRGGIE